jgi:predicted ATP-binding protein involved in virulence
MKIRSLHLVNYRGHAELRVDFKPGFNVVVGANGSGKTSLLKAVCDACSGLTAFINVPSGYYQPLKDGNVAHVHAVAFNGLFRFEPRFPVRVEVDGDAFGQTASWFVQRDGQASSGGVTPSGSCPGMIFNRMQSQAAEGSANAAVLDLPVVAFYRAHRHWTHDVPSQMQAALTRNSRLDGYGNWYDAALDSDALLIWAIGKCLERFQTSSETGVAFEEIVSDELALVNGALAAAVEGLKGLRYDLKQKSLLVEWVDGPTGSREPTAFENLSDGQRAVVCLVSDIARRMCVLNPQLGSNATAQTSGIVLIDEFDLHLHPRWQRILTSGLKRAFPSVQFIVASHSPQVLGELEADEIILLRPGQADHPHVSYGLTSNQVLEEIMGANARTPEVENRLNAVFEHLERGELALAREVIALLDSTAPGIPDLGGARALLRRKELIGR